MLYIRPNILMLQIYKKIGNFKRYYQKKVKYQKPYSLILTNLSLVV